MVLAGRKGWGEPLRLTRVTFVVTDWHQGSWGKQKTLAFLWPSIHNCWSTSRRTLVGIFVLLTITQFDSHAKFWKSLLYFDKKSEAVFLNFSEKNNVRYKWTWIKTYRKWISQIGFGYTYINISEFEFKAHIGWSYASKFCFCLF